MWTSQLIVFLVYWGTMAVDADIKPKMPDRLNEQTSSANTASTKCIWHQKRSLTIAKIKQKTTKNQFPGIKQTSPVTYTYKISRQVPKLATRLLQSCKTIFCH